MKYTFSFILILCLSFTLFTACGEAPESPTNAPVSQGESAANKEVAADENSTVSQQEEAVVSQKEPKEEPAQTVSSQTSVSLVSSAPSEVSGKPIPSQPVSSEDTSITTSSQFTTPSQNDVHASPPEYIPPSFTSMEGFHSWLQTGGIEDEKRVELLNNVKDSTTYSSTAYCSPKLGNGNNIFTLSSIEAYSYATLYQYCFTKNPKIDGLHITVYIHPIYMANCALRMQQRYDEINTPEDRVYDKYGVSVAEGISYYYYHFPANDSTTIYWKIGENTFRAKYYGDYSQINDILPLLELEQVEYKASNVEVVK